MQSDGIAPDRHLPHLQGIRLVVPAADREVMAEALNNRLGVTTGPDLTVDQVIAYALLNEAQREAS